MIFKKRNYAKKVSKAKEKLPLVSHVRIFNLSITQNLDLHLLLESFADDVEK